MSESESSESDKEPNTQKLPENISTQEIDDSYSDSDDDNLKSLYNVNKPSHIPGRYKYSMDQDSGKSIGANQTLEKQDYDEQDKDNLDKMTEHSSKKEVCEKQLEENDEDVADSTEKLNDNQKSLSDTGFFGKSMVMVSLGDLEKEEHPFLEKQSPPPVPPKPDRNLKRKSESKENSEAPKPAPRMTHKKKIIDTNTEDKLLLTDESLPKDEIPIPSPRVEINQSLPGSLQQEQNDMNDKGEEMTCDKEKIDEEENLEDTVDFGPSQDHEDNETNVTKTELSEENRDDIITDETHQVNVIKTEVRGESMASFIIHETPETSEGDIKEESFKQQGDNIITDDDIHSQNKDFDNDGNKDETTKGTDTEPGRKEAILEPNSDDESAGRYDNDFQEADSTKDNSDSDSEYGTAESLSDKENDMSDTNSPGKSGGDDDETSILDDKSFQHNISFPADSTLKTLSSNIVESFEIIGKGTVYKGYESLSSTVSSGEKLKSTDSFENNTLGNDIISETAGKRKSVRDITSMFENKTHDNAHRPTKRDPLHQTRITTKQDKTEETGDRETSPVISSATSSSSVDVLSLGDEEELEDHTDSGRQTVQDSEHIEKESSVQHVAEILTTEELKPARPDANGTESESNMLTTSSSDPDFSAFDRDGKQDDENLDGLANKQKDMNAMFESKSNKQTCRPNPYKDDLSESVVIVEKDDSDTSFVHELEDVPPPVAPKSDLVLESMRSLAMEYDSPPKIPPKSLPVEKHKLEEQFEGPQNINVGSEGWTQGLDPYKQQGEEYSLYNQSQQIAPRDDKPHNLNEWGSAAEWGPHQYQQGYNQPQPPFSGQNPEQQQQQYPATSQPFYYYDQAGNYQYPYAYNPNMYQGYQGMYYPTQDGRYHQQPLYYQHQVPQSMAQQYPYPQQFGVPTSMQQSSQPSQPFGMPTSMQHPSQQDSRQELYEAYSHRETGQGFIQQADRVNVRQNAKHQRTPNNIPETESKRKFYEDTTDDGYAEIGKVVENTAQLRTKSESEKAEKQRSSNAVRRSQSEVPQVRGSPRQSKQRPQQDKTSPPKEDQQLQRKKKTATKEEEETRPKEKEHYFLFKGINPKTKKENLSNFVEATSGTVDPEKIIFNALKDSALVVVNGKPDLEACRQRAQKRGIESYKPEIFEIEQPTCIAVSCEEEIKNKEGLELYFERPRIGGGELKGNCIESEDGSCFVIEFKEPAAVKRVCEMAKETPHKCDGKILRVSPYYTYKGGAIWDSELHAVRIPEPFIIKLQTIYTQFLQKSCCETLVSNLKENYCKHEFCGEGLKLQCTLGPAVDNLRQRVKEWETSSRDLVNTFIGEKIIERSIKVTGEHHVAIWSELMQYFDSEKIKSLPEIESSTDNNSYTIILVGFPEQVKAQDEKLKSKRDEIEKRLKRKTETLPIEPLKIRLLETIGKFDEMRRDIPDIEIFLGDKEITVEGQPSDINLVKLALHEAGKINHFKWEHTFTRPCVEFIKQNLEDKLGKILKENGVIAEWDIDFLQVHGFIYEEEVNERFGDEEDAYATCRFENEYEYVDVGDHRSRAIQWFKKSLAEEFEVIPEKILSSTEGSLFIADITETYDRDAGIDLTNSDTKLWIFGMSKEVKEIHTKLKQFLDENVVKEDRLKSGTIEIKLLRRHMGERITEIETSLKKAKVMIELEDESVKIRGTREGISRTKDELTKIFRSIVSRDHTIQKVAVKDVMRSERENGRIEQVENQTKCLIQLPGEDETVFVSTRYERKEGNETRRMENVRGATGGHYEEDIGSRRPQKQVFKAKNGVKITIIKGEIGKQEGNVIVATTSPNLNLSSGAACKSLLMAGGKELQDECAAKYPGGIKNGDIAVINGGGKLECNKIYLTSLPNWHSEDNPKQTLQKVMETSLEMASQHQKQSILFCAMGTGQLKYPVDIVAKEMFQSVIDFDNKKPGTSLSDVRFVLYQKDFPTIKAFEAEERIRIEGEGTRPTYDLQRGPIKIEVAVENIAEQKVDGIVCSISNDMDLSRKGACSALLRAGGQVLQDECKTKYSNSLDSEQVAEISPGTLSCKAVFLTVLPKYSPEAGAKLKKVIEACMQLAEAKRLTSLAFPALGAGNLRYPPDEVCHLMFETVTRWGLDHPATTLKRVRFIMHAKDRELIQKFKAFVHTTQGRGERKKRSLQHHDIHRPQSYHQKGDYNATENEFDIKGIKLRVIQGDILEQKTDVIVCSVNNKFEFIGGVAQALIKKCPELANDVQKKITKLQSDGLAMTNGYKGVPAKKIIHVVFVETPSQWKQQMLNCLEKANRKKCKTIAFPLLGTGQGALTLNPSEIAISLFDAVDEFAKKNSYRLTKKVSLVVFKTQIFMYQPVLSSLHKAVQSAAEGKHGLSIGKMAKGLFRSAKNFVTGATPGEMSKEDYKKMVEQTSSMQLKIYSDSADKIDKCIKELDLKLEQAYTKKTIDDYKELIKTLTTEEEKELDMVEFFANIKIDKIAGVISIDGPIREVGDAKSELQTRLLKIDRRRNEQKIAEENYKLFRWYFEEITNIGFEHVEYEKVLNLRIEQAYKANQNEVEFWDDKGNCYVIDLVNLVEYPKTDRQDTVKVLRKDILKQATAALPQEWAPMKDNENLRRVNVPNTEQIYKDIEQRFLTEVRGGQYAGRIMFDKNKLQVSKIERIQNKTLYQQYMAKKRLMSEQKPNLPPNMPIEQQLWHGTTHDAVDSIEMHGFNRSYCGKNGIWYGAGVYFAKCASYSARGWLTGAQSQQIGIQTGVKGYIFLSKVLTGEFCKGNDKMRYLPAVDPNKPLVLYDCAVDNVANPMEFVIFHDTQAYPEYIISFVA